MPTSSSKLVNVIPLRSFAHGQVGAVIEGVAREIPEDVAAQLVEAGYVALDVNKNGRPDKDQTLTATATTKMAAKATAKGGK